ncbi:cytochrome c maturation protein CcmE [Perlucidibaca piscinae]|uniref:cytochrome c maturation protein CcmE n=1 Tax=Perlucidibaca piscinae TaxID=392589 RepID=UPI0003B74770|nr:cytochrome c maturation protein CcmE [Perlucidibaca piscinae]
MHPQRRRRLIWLLVLVLGVGLVVALSSYALRQNINLFFTPSQLAANEASDGQRIQVGGLVLQGSVKRDPGSLAVHFTLTDLKHSVEVYYDGILPDLFREGQGIVANGEWRDGRVVAEEVLAKHDENYMPPQVKEAIEKAGHPGAAQ